MENWKGSERPRREGGRGIAAQRERERERTETDSTCVLLQWAYYRERKREGG